MAISDYSYGHIHCKVCSSKSTFFTPMIIRDNNIDYKISKSRHFFSLHQQASDEGL